MSELLVMVNEAVYIAENGGWIKPVYKVVNEAVHIAEFPWRWIFTGPFGAALKIKTRPWYL